MRALLLALVVPLVVSCTTLTLSSPARPEATAPALLTAPGRDLGTATAAPVPGIVGEGGSSTRVKAGVFYPDGDVSGLDNGFAGEVVFANEIIPFLAIEGSLGYIEALGERSGLDFELWSVPAFANGRLQLPILFFMGFAGAGIGGAYVDYEIGGVGDEDWVAAWNAFLGVEFSLGGWGAGVEVKYLQTDKTKDDFALEGTVVNLYASFGF
jgi:hypothetical protein